MRRRKGIIAGTTATLALAAGVGMWAFAAPGVAAPTTAITVVEHAVTDVEVDSDGDGGDSTGDVLTFHNKVYDETDDHRVGRDQGQCIRIDVRRGTWECAWTTYLDGGQITVEGPFNDAEDTVLAITGGTGDYADARGSMQLSVHPSVTGSEYEFAFELT
jgi:allene oxide cyclase